MTTTVPGTTRSFVHVSLIDDENRVTIEIEGPGQMPAVATVDTQELLEALGYIDTTVTVEESDELARWPTGSARSSTRPSPRSSRRSAPCGGSPRTPGGRRAAACGRRPCTLIPLPAVGTVVENDWTDGNVVLETRGGARQVVHPDYLEPVGEPRVGDRVQVRAMDRRLAGCERRGPAGVVQIDRPTRHATRIHVRFDGPGGLATAPRRRARGHPCEPPPADRHRAQGRSRPRQPPADRDRPADRRRLRRVQPGEEPLRPPRVRHEPEEPQLHHPKGSSMSDDFKYPGVRQDPRRTRTTTTGTRWSTSGPSAARSSAPSPAALRAEAADLAACLKEIHAAGATSRPRSPARRTSAPSRPSSPRSSRAGRSRAASRRPPSRPAPRGRADPDVRPRRDDLPLGPGQEGPVAGVVVPDPEGHRRPVRAAVDPRLT